MQSSFFFSAEQLAELTIDQLVEARNDANIYHTAARGYVRHERLEAERAQIQAITDEIAKRREALA